jgi:gamma-glutamyltranspeptidase
MEIQTLLRKVEILNSFLIDNSCILQQLLSILLGGLSIAVPGTMKGLWTAHKMFGGRTSWKELLMPTVELCEQGIPIGEHMADELLRKKKLIESNSEFR